MVLLGSSADPNVVEKMVGESAKNNVQSQTGDKEDFPCVKGDNKGEELVLKGEMDEFVSAQLEATAPRTMDKAMLRLNLKKPKFTMGRSKEADLCIKDINVSRRHAEFTWKSSDGWGVTNYSDNGVWVNKIPLAKGTSIALKPGDLVVLSNLGNLFSWRFHLGENRDGSKYLKRVGFQSDEGEDQPSSKRQKVGLDSERTRGRGEGSASRELIHILQKKKEAAEMKYAVMKQAVVAAAKEGKRKHDALESEKEQLLERLEKKAREDAARAEEARQALERGGGGEEERSKLEARLLQEREEASNEKKKLLEDLESKMLEEKRKREEDLEERDQQLELIKSEKVAAEEKFESDRIRMEEELGKLKSQLEAKEVDEDSKEKAYQEKMEEMNMRMEAELQEEKEKLAKQVAEQEQKEKEARKKEEEEREREREAHALELVALREQQNRREEEVERKCKELEEKQELQASIEAKVMQQKEELERRKTEEEAFDAASAREERVAALEKEKEEVADQLEQARQQAGKLEAEKEEGNRVLLGKLANTLESQYQCPTCLDLFISPVSLNCGHTYCWLCLAQWRRSSSVGTWAGRSTRGDLGSCPQCRVPVQHENRVYAIDQMIEELLGHLGPEKTAERSQAIAERKEEEATFLATATPKEKGRMRGGGRGGAATRGGGRGRGPRDLDQGHVDQAAARGGGRGRGGRMLEALNRARGANVQGPSGRGGDAARGGPGARINPSANGRNNVPAQSDIARFFPGNQASRNVQEHDNVMERASANGGAGGSGMAAAMARVWARRQEERAGVSGAGPGEQVRANSGGDQGVAGGSARQATNEPQGGAIEISSDSEEWPDARDSDEDSDSSVGRPNDMPAAHHEVSSDSDSDTVEEEDEVVAGLPGAPYRGFGRCFKCDRLGHWAPGCPF